MACYDMMMLDEDNSENLNNEVDDFLFLKLCRRHLMVCDDLHRIHLKEEFQSQPRIKGNLEVGLRGTGQEPRLALVDQGPLRCKREERGGAGEVQKVTILGTHKRKFEKLMLSGLNIGNIGECEQLP